MNISWNIDRKDVSKIKEFLGQHGDNRFVKGRIKRNLAKNKPAVTQACFWERMVGCLLTTQQRSGPGSSVKKFVGITPFPLSYVLCRKQDDSAVFVTKVLRNFGVPRRSNIIGEQAGANLSYLEDGGWQPTFGILEQLRRNSTPANERVAARFIDDHFKGFGPKQSRNLIQQLGLSRFEVPIDSRITKWLNAFGFPVRLTANALADRSYYEFVSEGFQRLCESCDIFPCVLDAAIFSSFDKGGWTEENV